MFVPEIRRELDHFPIGIESGTVPTNDGADRHRVTKIMNARTTTPFARWASVTNADCHSNPSEDRFDIVGAWTPAPLVEEEWLGPVAKNPVAHRAVGAQVLCGRERDREQPKLAILRSCDCQHLLVEVDIGLTGLVRGAFASPPGSGRESSLVDDIPTRIVLENEGDRQWFLRGGCPESAIRTLVVDAVADVASGALLLPEEVVAALGLGDRGVVLATPAEVSDPPPPVRSHEQRPVAGPVAVRLGNRSMVTDCVVVPRGTQPRVGHLVLTRLDLDFDYDRETVVPRCPDYPLLRI